MSSLLKQFSDVLGAKVRSAQKTSPGFGLKIEMAQRSDIGAGFASDTQNGKYRHAHPALWDLAQDHQLIVIENAYINGVEPNLELTGVAAKLGLHNPDFLHRDSGTQGDLLGSATLLYKHYISASRVPTEFTRIGDARRALARITVDDLDLPPELQEQGARHLQAMQQTDYGFTLMFADREPRTFFKRHAPHLGQLVLSKINPDRVYRHLWTPGDFSIVISANPESVNQNSLLHGRSLIDASDEDPLRGVAFVRTLEY